MLPFTFRLFVHEDKVSLPLWTSSALLSYRNRTNKKNYEGTLPKPKYYSDRAQMGLSLVGHLSSAGQGARSHGTNVYREYILGRGELQGCRTHCGVQLASHKPGEQSSKGLWCQRKAVKCLLPASMSLSFLFCTVLLLRCCNRGHFYISRLLWKGYSYFATFSWTTSTWISALIPTQYLNCRRLCT